MTALVCALSLISTPAAATSSPANDVVAFDSGRWQVNDKQGRAEEHLGRPSLFLKSGFAFLKDAAFEDGVIEVDIAAPDARSFVGVVFRFESEDEHEIVYFRPHKSGLDDAVQYTPSFNGSACWQLYSGRGYTAAAEFPRRRWVRARIEVAGLGAKVFLDGAGRPALAVEDLKHGHKRGTVGLWAGAGGGHFSNFTFRAAGPGERRPRPAPTYAAGLLTKWELSEAFDVPAQDAEALPGALNSLKWERVGVEPPGMVVIDRHRRSPSVVRFFAEPAERTGARPGRKVVYARAVLHAERDAVKRLSLGYSDEATVFLNGRPVFTGRSAFRYRDPGFLGIMDVENDAVYLDLRRGRNELVLAVADYFGGWGFIARLDDPAGVRQQ